MYANFSRKYCGGIERRRERSKINQTEARLSHAEYQDDEITAD